MKKIFYTLLGMSLMFAGTIYALPFFSAQKTLIPTDSNQDLGTTTTQVGQGTLWRNIFMQGNSSGSTKCVNISSVGL